MTHFSTTTPTTLGSRNRLALWRAGGLAILLAILIGMYQQSTAPRRDALDSVSGRDSASGRDSVSGRDSASGRDSGRGWDDAGQPPGVNAARSGRRPVAAVPTKSPATNESPRQAALAPGVVRIPWGSPRRRSVTEQQLDRAIREATKYLVRVCDDEGRFVYELDVDTGRPTGNRYNVLRHAGTMYALAKAYRRDGDPAALEALRRAAGFLRRECIAPVPEQDDVWAVWSPPQLTGSQDPRQAKLGGTGLGLLALVELEQLAPGSVPRDELRRLGRFLAFMQKPDGSFHSKYFPDSGRDDRWTSLYYPGEAALGAVRLYELDGQAEWLHVAARAIAYLARREAFDAPPLPDHWMLLALEQLLPNYARAELNVPREQLLRHARRTCRGIIAEQAPRRGDPLLDGSFGLDGRTAPAATRLEGLLAARALLPGDDRRLQAELERSIESGIRFLLRCQVLDGPWAGAVPLAQGPLPGNDARTGRFNERVHRVRIDYVQHALCAWIEYERQFGEPPKASMVPAEAPADSRE